MKKIKKLVSFIVIFISLFFMVGCFNNQTTVTTSENYLMDFEFMDNYMYDFESGLMIEDINYAISSKECTYSDEVVLNNYHNVSYIFFWTQTNQFIGYYATEGSIITYDKYIMTYSSNNLVLPNNTYRMAFMVNKNGIDGYYRLGLETYLDDSFEVIMSYDKTSYVFQSIDDYVDIVEGYEDLTYRDIFGDTLFGSGKTNLIDNGDFSVDSNSDGLADNWSKYTNNNSYIVGNIQHVNCTIDYTNIGIYQSFDFNINNTHIYYFTAIIHCDTDINTAVYLGGGTSYDINNFIHSDIAIIIEPINELPIMYMVNYNKLSTEIYSFSNIMLFDLTTIFDGYILPSEEQFTLMVEEYQRLEDYTVTIGDINTSAFRSVKNKMSDSVLWTSEIAIMDLLMITNYDFDNLISNGDFSENVSGWGGAYNALVSWDSGTQSLKSLDNLVGASNYAFYPSLIDYIIGNDYYISYDFTHYYDSDSNSIVYWVGPQPLHLLDNIPKGEKVSISSVGEATQITPYNRFYNHYGTTDMIEGVTYILLDNVMLFDTTANSISLTQTQMDEMTDLFIYVDDIDFPYINDQDFNVYYTYYDTDNSNNPIDDYDRVVVFSRFDTDESNLLSTWSSLTTEEIYQIIFDTSFYNNEYNSTTLLSYGDYVDTELFLVNPSLYYNLFDYDDKYSLDLQEDYRDNVMNLFWSYKNGEERFEFFVDYDITEDNFDGFYSEYLIQLEEITKVSYANLSTMVVSGTMVYSIHEYEISEVLDNFILSIGMDTDFIFVLISILIFGISILILALKSAPKNIIILSVLVELLLFVILGWIDKWIILVLALMLFLMVLMVILKKRG